jgi:hypothetical protein
MDTSRPVTALVGLVASLAISAAIYVVTGSMLLFVVVPVVPFLFTRSHGGETEGSDRSRRGSVRSVASGPAPQSSSTVPGTAAASRSRLADGLKPSPTEP